MQQKITELDWSVLSNDVKNALILFGEEHGYGYRIGRRLPDIGEMIEFLNDRKIIHIFKNTTSNMWTVTFDGTKTVFTKTELVDSLLEAITSFGK